MSLVGERPLRYVKVLEDRSFNLPCKANGDPTILPITPFFQLAME